jgi:hypothetical protein
MKSPPLSQWLKANDFERFIGIFEENEVDLATLRNPSSGRDEASFDHHHLVSIGLLQFRLGDGFAVAGAPNT